MSWIGNTYYDDDGSTLSIGADGNYTATPYAAADMIQGASGSDSTGFFDVLNGFTGLVTKVGGSISTLQAQADNLAGLKAASELQRARQAAALTIGRAGLDVATLNAQRDVAIAKANVAGLGGNSTLLLLALAGGLAMMASQQ